MDFLKVPKGGPFGSAGGRIPERREGVRPRPPKSAPEANGKTNNPLVEVEDGELHQTSKTGNVKPLGFSMDKRFSTSKEVELLGFNLNDTQVTKEHPNETIKKS